ncbi:hypothetical protein ACQKH5_04530 [Hyphomonas sp. NPDC076900]|uniref:hypothetical protein n=1 Tax=unclassified Hyphomonas TaxID=2630699 RepID=UPI003D05B793
MTRSPSLAEDLSYIRDLAEAGQNAPLLGGRFLAMWGGLVTLAYLGHFLIATGPVQLGGEAYLYLWIVFGLLGGIGQFLLVSASRGKPGQASAGNRVQAVLWTASGIFLSVFFLGLIARMLLTGEGVEGFYWSVPMVLGLYGIGQYVTGAISGQGALKFAGIAAFAGVLAAVFLTGTEYIWLAGAASAFLAVFVPGLMMMRAEPSESV